MDKNDWNPAHFEQVLEQRAIDAAIQGCTTCEASISGDECPGFAVDVDDITNTPLRVRAVV